LYEKGMAFQHAIQARKKFKTIDSDRDGYEQALKDVRTELKFSVEAGVDDVTVIRLWQNYLVRFGRDLDRQIDALSTEVIACQDSWRDDKSRIKTILDCLLDYRFPIRNFEEEVQEYTLHVTTRSIVIDGMSDVPNQVLTEIHGTYSRAFDICALKLNSINSGRITATNTVLSILALIVAILTSVRDKKRRD
jgi:hypothetical protein